MGVGFESSFSVSRASVLTIEPTLQLLVILSPVIFTMDFCSWTDPEPHSPAIGIHPEQGLGLLECAAWSLLMCILYADWSEGWAQAQQVLEPRLQQESQCEHSGQGIH